ncbi:MAG TPA: hypothetical protein VGL89_13600 [Candidatus Koribacter sp.]|jgi:hypothetical protein
MRKFLATVFVLASLAYVLYLVGYVVIMTVAEVAAGHGRAVLMFWTLTVGAVGLSEFVWLAYLNFVSSTFSEQHAIDEIPSRTGWIEKALREAKVWLQAFVGIAAFVLILHSFLEDFMDIHEWRIVFAFWVFGTTGVLTWMLIGDLYTRYATSILSERHVTPVPFARR